MAKAEKVTRKVVDLHAAARAAEVKGGKSNIASTRNKTADALVQNIRG